MTSRAVVGVSVRQTAATLVPRVRVALERARSTIEEIVAMTGMTRTPV